MNQTPVGGGRNRRPSGAQGGKNRPNAAARGSAGASQKRKGKSKKKRAGALTAFLSVILVFFLTACIVSGYVLANAFLEINGDVAINLDDTKNNQNQTSFIYAYDDDGKVVEYIRLHGEINRIWVGLEKIPQRLVDAFIALEDKRFYSHQGVDILRLGSVISSLSFNEGGASTITQQLIKNITGESDVTSVRKYNEILSAFNLEKNYEKKDILEAYLNTVYLDSGCYGVKTAAEKYFGKELNSLTIAECAALASITKAPYYYDPLYNPENNKDRRNYCLRLMLEQEFISQKQYDEAVKSDIIFTNDPRYVSDESKESTAKKEKKEEYQSFYVDYIIDSVINDLVNKLGYTKADATKMIYYGGLKIYSAVNLKIQETLEKVYSSRSAFPYPNEPDTKERPAVQSSMTIMDYKGRVVGIVGQAGKKERNRCLNRASSSPRQPGSSIKPLSVYAPGIETDSITWSSMIPNSAIAVGGKMWPENVDGTLGDGGKKTVQYAIKVSLNTTAARVVYNFLPNGIKTSLDYLQNRFHLSHVDPVNDASLPPVAVGAMTNGATTVEMASAYAAFGNGGMYYKPYCYYEVLDSKGEVILSNKNVEGERAISAETADIMCELLQTVPTSSYGTGYTVQNFPIFCKTGTTDKEKDRWFCAGTPYYVCSIWYGYDKPKSINSSLNPCGKIFLDIFSKIHKNLAVTSFGKSGKTVKKPYCASTGLLAGKNCEIGGYGWYKTSYVPSTCSSCSGSVSIIDDIIDTGSRIFPELWNFIYGNSTTITTATAADDHAVYADEED
ncbi:MAG: hypothetical protein GX107_09110 [Clostridiales bacterium]|nr:hypothetical protein [Clostridiales bacterium]